MSENAALGAQAPWSHTHVWDRPSWTVDELVAAKRGRTVSVVLPALDEEATVAGVVASIAPLLGGLVDELVVLDSGSTDATAQRARAAGARVVARTDVFADVAPRPGKGEALWRAVAATTGDLIAFVDADLVDPDPDFVPRLIGPLLLDPAIQLVKGYYRRPLTEGGAQVADGGGRVTELAARPLLTALKPELGEVIQPLGGEYAGTRELLSSVPFAAGYGVEIGLLVDTYDRYGLAGIGQVNLGVRVHRNRPLAELAVMSRQIIATLLDRCGVADSGVGLTQFVPGTDGTFTPHQAALTVAERPPVDQLRAQRSRDVQ